MSIYNIPIGVAKEIKSIKTWFLWSTKGGERNITWIRWKDVCCPKNHKAKNEIFYVI